MNFNQDLIKRYFTHTCTPEEVKRVKRWFATAEGQEYLSLQMNKDIEEWGRIEKLDLDHEVPTGVIFEKIERTMRRHSYRQWFFRAAAIVIPLVLTFSLGWLLFKPMQESFPLLVHEVKVQRGEKLQVLLQDGTRIWVNADSRLSYPDNFNQKERWVRLEGEGYFEVASNKQKPFRVELSGMEVQVTGTAFNIKAYPEDSVIYTSLCEGSIYLENKIVRSQSVAMLPGQMATFSSNSGFCKVENAEDIRSYSDWKNDYLIFRKTPLREVIKILERRFNCDIQVEDACLYKYTYTITFHEESFEKILRDMERITPITVRQIDGVYKLYARKNNS